MSIAEFFQENWGILAQAFIAIIGIIIIWCIYCKEKADRRKEKEENIKKDIPLRLEKIEYSIGLLTTLYPQLKSLEKLDSFKKLNLTQEDIRKIVSEVLQTTNIIPETIELKVEEKIEKKLNSFENGIAAIIAQKLNLIDKQFGKPIGNSVDYLTLALVEYFKRNYLATIQYLDKAIEINPNYDLAWYNKGVALGKLNLHEEAIKAFDKAIEINPNYDKAWYGKGFESINFNLHEEAIKAFDKAIEINPNYDKAWYNKGVALGKLNLHEEAIKAFDKTIEINPNYADAWYGNALIYYLKRDKGNALKYLSKAIELKPKYKKNAKIFENI